MTTIAAPRTVAAPQPPSTTSRDLTGTWSRLRLVLRRDRIVAPLWVAVIGLVLPSTYVSSIDSVYPTDADRERFAASTASSPAQIAMYGPMFNASPGMVTIWKAGALFTVIAVAVILTVIRHTRVEEELGRAEVVQSTAVGRYSGLTAALMLAGGGSVVAGVLATAALLGGGLPTGGSVGYGAALAGSGLVFAGVAAVAAQLTTSARTARGIAFAVLATTFALRAVGDAGSGQLSWLAPQGWSLQLRPYASERWWVLVLHVVATVALVVAAYALLRHRDVGAGLIAERRGPATASTVLSGPLGLAWRLHRGTLVAWTAGLAIYALLIGTVAHGIGDEIGDSTAITDTLTRTGGPASLDSAFIGFGFTVLGIAGAGYAVSAALRLHAEEAAGRGETVLTGAVGRTRWAASHIVFALVGPAIALLVAGLVAGVAYGIATDDMKAVPDVLGAAAVQLPAIWLLTAITVALFGLAPRFTPVAWGVLVAFLVLFMVGSVADLPQAVLDLEPFGHLPALPGGEFTAAPVLWLLAIDAVLIGVGTVAFRRRDLR